MDNIAITEMQKQEQNYWWHVSRRFILKTVLAKFFLCHPELDSGSMIDSGSKSGMTRGESGMTDNKINIIDVGCGTGINFAWLNKFGNVIGVDNNQEAVKFCQKYGNVKWGKAEQLPFKNNSYNLLTAFDILEHTQDDMGVLKEWYRVLQPKGYLYITVPAYQWLFGPHDRQLMHHRRYLLSNLLKLLKQAGFTPIFASYFFIFTFPLLMFQRLIAKIFNITPGYTKISQNINNLLIKITNLESALLKNAPLPFGSSIMILARKDEATNN